MPQAICSRQTGDRFTWALPIGPPHPHPPIQTFPILQSPAGPRLLQEGCLESWPGPAPMVEGCPGPCPLTAGPAGGSWRVAGLPTPTGCPWEPLGRDPARRESQRPPFCRMRAVQEYPGDRFGKRPPIVPGEWGKPGNNGSLGTCLPGCAGSASLSTSVAGPLGLTHRR